MRQTGAEVRPRFRRWAIGLAAAVVALGAGLATTAQAASCAFPSAPRVIVNEGPKSAKGSRLVQVWDVPDSTVYWSAADPVGAAGVAYREFKAGVPKHVPVTDPITLLRDAWVSGVPALRQSNAMLASRAAEWVRPAGCLEKLLISVQHDRVDLFESRTEFAAIVLHSSGGGRLRIYFMTANEDGIGRMSALTDPVMRDIRAGWRADIALHNHSFSPKDPATNGVLAPSEADAQFAANLAGQARLKSAWITNGLHTSRIPAAAFGLFVIPPAAKPAG